MATPLIKSTYSLDVDSVRALDALARRWQVSKSEALRRAIRGAVGSESPEAKGALETLDRLQAMLALSPHKGRERARAARRERIAASVARERALR